MRIGRLGLIWIFAAALGVTGISGVQAQDNGHQHPGTAYRIIVIYKSDALSLTQEAAEQKAEQFSERLGLRVEHVMRLPGNTQVILVWDEGGERNFEAIMNAIQEDPAVEHVELDSMLVTQPDG